MANKKTKSGLRNKKIFVCVTEDEKETFEDFANSERQSPGPLARKILLDKVDEEKSK